MEADQSLLRIDDELKPAVRKPLPRCGHVAVHLNRNIIIFSGGYTGSVPDHKWKYFSLRVIWSYNLDIDRWIKLIIPETKEIPEPRVEACAVVIGSHVYFYGGWTYPTEESTGIVFVRLWKLSRTAEGRVTWTCDTFTKKKM